MNQVNEHEFEDKKHYMMVIFYMQSDKTQWLKLI